MAPRSLPLDRRGCSNVPVWFGRFPGRSTGDGPPGRFRHGQRRQDRRWSSTAQAEPDNCQRAVCLRAVSRSCYPYALVERLERYRSRPRRPRPDPSIVGLVITRAGDAVLPWYGAATA
jgi:hypothetical protein